MYFANKPDKQVIDLFQPNSYRVDMECLRQLTLLWPHIPDLWPRATYQVMSHFRRSDRPTHPAMNFPGTWPYIPNADSYQFITDTRQSMSRIHIP